MFSCIIDLFNRSALQPCLGPPPFRSLRTSVPDVTRPVAAGPVALFLHTATASISMPVVLAPLFTGGLVQQTNFSDGILAKPLDRPTASCYRGLSPP